MAETIRNKSRSTIWRYYAFTFFISLHFFASVMVPFFTDWGHISRTQMQLLQSWFMLWIFILEIPTGVVADFLGRKYSLALGALIVAFGALLYGSIPDIRVFFMAEFLFAAGIALVSGADSALLYDALKESGQEDKSKEIFGKAHAITLTGFFVAAIVGGFMASKFGLNAPQLFTSIPLLFAAIIALSIREPKIHEGPSESRRYWDIAKKGFLYFYRHEKLRTVAIDATVVASAAYFVLWLYQPVLQLLHVPIAQFGLFHGFLVVTEMIIAANFMRLEKFFGSAKRFLRFTAIVTGVSFIVLAAFPNIFTILAFIALAGGFGLTRLEYITAYMNKLIPSAERATVLSSISMFRRFALVLLNPFIGFVADQSIRSALFIVGLIPLALLLFPLFKREKT